MQLPGRESDELSKQHSWNRDEKFNEKIDFIGQVGENLYQEYITAYHDPNLQIW